MGRCHWGVVAPFDYTYCAVGAGEGSLKVTTAEAFCHPDKSWASTSYDQAEEADGHLSNQDCGSRLTTQMNLPFQNFR